MPRTNTCVRTCRPKHHPTHLFSRSSFLLFGWHEKSSFPLTSSPCPASSSQCLPSSCFGCQLVAQIERHSVKTNSIWDRTFSWRQINVTWWRIVLFCSNEHFCDFYARIVVTCRSDAFDGGDCSNSRLVISPPHPSSKKTQLSPMHQLYLLKTAKKCSITI